MNAPSLGPLHPQPSFGVRSCLRPTVERVVCFGKAGPTIASQLDSAVPLDVAPDLGAAVRAAASSANPGTTVLLSPGCASFDEFRDFAERGQRFRELVEAL